MLLVLKLIIAGCVSTWFELVLQPLPSVTVTVYVPAAKPDRFWVVIPLLHK